MTGPVSPASGSAAAPAAKADIGKAARAFEAVFLRQMIGSMRQASLGDELFGSSAGEQFRDMADARLADQMAAGKGFGIAELLVKQFAARTVSSAEETKK